MQRRPLWTFWTTLLTPTGYDKNNVFWSFSSRAILELFSFSGLYPTDDYEEGVANMICDGVSDLLNGLIKMAHEKDETKKVTNPCLVYFDA